ncbi:MAG: zinc-binding dehydrogenase, partial [Spirochaetia bacterium]
RGIYILPEGVSYEHAAMVEPVSIAMHAAEITPHETGDAAVVVGAGMIGLLVVQVLRATGYGPVIAADIDDRKLEKATALGADRVVNTKTAELWPVVAELTEGRGVRSAFDAVGLQASFDSAVSSVRRGGTVTVIGNFAPKIEAPLQYLVTRQIRVQGSNASSGEYPACLEMIRRGAVDLDPLVSAVAPLSEGAEWFRRLYKGDEGLMKVILKPGT